MGLGGNVGQELEDAAWSLVDNDTKVMLEVSNGDYVLFDKQDMKRAVQVTTMLLHQMELAERRMKYHQKKTLREAERILEGVHV